MDPYRYELDNTIKNYYILMDPYTYEARQRLYEARQRLYWPECS